MRYRLAAVALFSLIMLAADRLLHYVVPPLMKTWVAITGPAMPLLLIAAIATASGAYAYCARARRS